MRNLTKKNLTENKTKQKYEIRWLWLVDTIANFDKDSQKLHFCLKIINSYLFKRKNLAVMFKIAGKKTRTMNNFKKLLRHPH